jgi:cellulose synthase/poly-beta-1,6-N-acetylglucosamine synthase-like glycosyltransferase
MDQKKNSQNEVCVTANWLSLRSTITDFGGFNSKLKSGGDHELSKLISKSGLSVEYCKEAYVLHPARSVSELLAKRRRVIGGSWDRSDRHIKFLLFSWQALKLFLKRFTQVLRHSKLAYKNKIHLIILLIRIFTVSNLELGRLALGGHTNRS